MDELSSHIYMTSNALSRRISELADHRFRPYGFSASYAFLILAVYREDGIGQKIVCDRFHLAPSTVTRFIDKLAEMGLVYREKNGKRVTLQLTDEGRSVAAKLEHELFQLNRNLSELWGSKFTETLNKMNIHGLGLLNEDESD